MIVFESLNTNKYNENLLIKNNKMKNITNKKCSFEGHKNIDAISYCSKCDIYICEKCRDYHNNLINRNHKQINLYNKENNDENIEICLEQNHQEKLEYFCRTHNKLCCRACVTKIKGLGNGQHSECNICFIKDISKERKNKLKQNIIYLENNKTSFDSLINKLRIIYKEISDKKERLKIRIQKFFTKIRNEINRREDQLLLTVEQVYEKYFFNKNFNKNIDNIENHLNLSLKKVTIVLNEYNNDEINFISLVKDCIIIEDFIKEINFLKEHYERYEKNNAISIDLKLKEEEIKLLDNIKDLGNIYQNNFFFKLRNYFDEYNYTNRKYIIIGEKENVAKKMVEDNQFTLIRSENKLEYNKIYKWRINILNSKLKVILLGISRDEEEFNPSLNNLNGWYFYCFNSTLYSCKPHNYKNKKTNLDKINKDIIITFDMNKGTLAFISENKIESCYNIPLDKPLYPSILLYDKYDTIEINEY